LCGVFLFYSVLTFRIFAFTLFVYPTFFWCQ